MKDLKDENFYALDSDVLHFLICLNAAGATLGRGLNRGLATFLAGALGFGAHHLAVLSGEKVQPILLALFVFLLGST